MMHIQLNSSLSRGHGPSASKANNLALPVVSRSELTNKGFTLIVGVLLLTAVLLVGLIALAESSFTMNDIQNFSRDFAETSATSDSCLEEALIRLKRDPLIRTASLRMGGNSCTIGIDPLASPQYRVQTTTTSAAGPIVRTETIVERRPRGQGIQVRIISYSIL